MESLSLHPPTKLDMSQTENNSDLTTSEPVQGEPKLVSVRKETFSSRARAAMTKTPRNPNPQPLAEDKPPRAAPSGKRARSNTTMPMEGQAGNKKLTRKRLFLTTGQSFRRRQMFRMLMVGLDIASS